MTLYKVEVGSALYKEGIRWTESIRQFGRTWQDRTHSMVLHYKLAISLIILMLFMTLIKIIS